MKVIPPGSIIGILGGGQLARMTAMAAARLGYRTHIFCADKNEPALQVAAFSTIASFANRAALEKFASAVDVVTLETENVPLDAVAGLVKKVPLRPGADVLRVAQDRIQEKTFARKIGIGTADFVAVHSVAELEKALRKFPLPAILKSTRMGYDGKGQVRVTPGMKATAAWKQMGGNEAILEAFVDFDCEVSVIVARREDGAMAAYPAVRNIHRNHVLAETHAPAGIAKNIINEAERTACKLAEKLKVVGLLAVEMFVLKKPDAKGRRILMNEIAPRPHNSGHWTIDACAVSQFEQLVRAICGLPLGSPAPHSRAEMHNLLGHDIDKWPSLLKKANACLHVYGKAETRAGRKMGHVTYVKGKWK
jgi:5-(carboxyamino)imidazole ribonucleotide synthase